MPRTFLTRAVHVVETDERARKEAEAHIVRAYASGRERIEGTRVVYKGPEVNPDTREINRVFQGMTTGVKGGEKLYQQGGEKLYH